MELDLKCLKMTYWNKTYGIGPVNGKGIRPADACMDTTRSEKDTNRALMRARGRLLGS